MGSALHATKIRLDRPIVRAIRAIASAALATALATTLAAALSTALATALATALTTALHPGAASAQAPESDPGESEAKAVEETGKDSTGATSTATEPKPVKPAAKTSKPFTPTERIEAESVISFPANI